MAIAIAIQDAHEVLDAYTVDGQRWLVIPCADYDAFRATPAGLWFDGLTYTRRGWNSDTGRAYYVLGTAFAVPA